MLQAKCTQCGLVITNNLVGAKPEVVFKMFAEELSKHFGAIHPRVVQEIALHSAVMNSVCFLREFEINDEQVEEDIEKMREVVMNFVTRDIPEEEEEEEELEQTEEQAAKDAEMNERLEKFLTESFNLAKYHDLAESFENEAKELLKYFFESETSETALISDPSVVIHT